MVMAPSGEMGTPARSSMRLSLQQDDNEYDLEALGGISDGFRFNQSQQPDPEPEISQVELPPRRSQFLMQSQYNINNNNNNPPVRPSSVSKPRFATDNFALRHDGTMGPSASATSASPTIQSNQVTSLSSRSSSVSTISTQSTVMHSEGPYQGPSGPSYPYQMYPQNTRLARTMSVATTSTAAVLERPYEGPTAGPIHPYEMYPQSITPGTSLSIPAVAIPIGFPGLNNDSQRRIGPEGEEAADIIGSDGHTEQLPPYTQYPDAVLARKERALAVPALAVSALALGSGAGGLGLATRNPEFDSPRDEAQSPLSRIGRDSMISRGSSQQTSLTATPGPTLEKPELKHWQIVAKRKVCGIVPIWVFVLMGVTILLMVAILAGVLSALKPKQHKTKPHPHGMQPGTSPQTIVYSTITTTFGVKPTTVPISFPTLPTGTFSLNLGSPQDTQTDCIENSAQLSTWSCQLPPIPISINVTTDDDTKQSMAILSAGQIIYPWNYGTQLPIISMERKLDLVIDMGNPSYGPAWFFQVPFNKLIVLHESQLSVSTTSEGKREASFNPSTKNINRKSPTQPGDVAWFCYWNGTLLETFIFANETSAAGVEEASSSSAYPSASSANAYAASASRTGSGGYPSPTARSDRRQVVPGTYQYPPPDGSYSSPPSSASGQPKFLNGYPKIVKIEERRIPEGSLASPPYCVSMTISDDGPPTPNVDATGSPITIELNETDPTLSQMSQKRGYAKLPGRGTDPLSRDTPGDCSCVWMAT